MKYKELLITLILLILMSSYSLNSQNNDDDYTALSKQKNTKEKVIQLNQIADSLFIISREQSLKIFGQALEIADKIGYLEGMIDNHYYKGFNFLNINDLKNALKEFEICYKYLDKIDNSRKISCLEAMGFINSSTGNYKNAKSNFLKMIEIYKNSKNNYGKISEIYTKIGNVELFEAKVYSAQEMYLKSLQYAMKTKNKSLIADCYVNMGIVKNSLEDRKTAKKFLFDALKINKTNRNNIRIANNLANLSKVYIDEKNYDSALVFLFRGLEYLNITDDKLIRANILSDIAQIYALENDNKQALFYADKAKNINYDIDNKIGYYWDLLNIVKIYLKTKTKTEIVKKYLDTICNSANNFNFQLLLNYAYGEYAKYYFLKGDKDSMHYYWQMHIIMTDSIYTGNLNNKIANLEEKFKLEQKLKEEQSRLQTNQRETFIIILSSIAGALILLIVSIIIANERRKSEKLLLNVLPKTIANRLKSKNKLIADHYDSASIVFIDITRFTDISKDAEPEKIVELLNKIYTEFDHIAEKYGLEKIKTIGDCYMAVSGVPEERDNHEELAAMFALDAMEKLSGFDIGNGHKIQFKCGIDCGPIVAGVIGEKKFIYDLWGDAVNTASRMEENGVAGKIQCTERFVNNVNINKKIQIKFEQRGEIEIKGKGLMKTYFLKRENNE